MSSEQGACIGIVVIGRNEGERLKACLKSAVAPGRLIVYVDSGSSDGSVLFAKSLGVTVVELDVSTGFTAARARNAGVRELLLRAPHVEYVQFIDGDCRLVDSWLERGVSFLELHHEYAVVCGRRSEIHPARNYFHRLTDLEWDTPIGEAKYCGGDALFRVVAFQKCGGYRDALIAGEEPELCVRLRKDGWRIFRLDEDMTLHDINMSYWRQWWKRCVRAGHAYAEGARLHGAPPERHWTKERRGIFTWGIAVPLAAILLAWSTGGASIVAAIVCYAFLVIKTMRHFIMKRGWPVEMASIYAFHCVAAKVPQAWGLLLYEGKRLLGRQSTIIEYSPVPQRATRGHDLSPRDVPAGQISK